jgi:hypothetical protein
MTPKEQKLVDLYQKMSELTRPLCGNGCGALRMGSCCDPEYCQMTRNFAKDVWDVKLSPTEHEKLPLMGPEGCTAAPHLRPWCTLHVCHINSLGFIRGKPDLTKEYFELRGEIDEAEWERMDASVVEGGPAEPSKR